MRDLSMCQCAKCLLFFEDCASFDAHRTGSFDPPGRRCLTRSEMRLARLSPLAGQAACRHCDAYPGRETAKWRPGEAASDLANDHAADPLHQRVQGKLRWPDYREQLRIPLLSRPTRNQAGAAEYHDEPEQRIPAGRGPTGTRRVEDLFFFATSTSFTSRS